MKRSEVIKELLSSYHFQNGKNADRKVVNEAMKLISIYEKRELKNLTNESEEK